MLKRLVDVVEIAAVIAAGVFVVLLFVNDPSGPTPTATGAGTTTPSGIDGAFVFSENCASCHGQEGEGGFGPELAGGAVVKAFPDPDDQVRFVSDGSGPMPAFGSRLSTEEIEAVVAYTREEL